MAPTTDELSSKKKRQKCFGDDDADDSKNFLTTRDVIISSMGQSYAKYCHLTKMVKHPVDSFDVMTQHRETLHGRSDFTLVVKGIRFQCHKSVLMASSRYFETMLTLFDERLKAEVELKDIVEPTAMALSLHFIYEGNHSTNVIKKRLLSKSNVHDLLQLANYLQIQSLQSICCKYIQVRNLTFFSGILLLRVRFCIQKIKSAVARALLLVGAELYRYRYQISDIDHN
jgi:hypothetical protein